jgi:ABC-type multidrug transport system fused ATPase/permease subunit
MYDKVAKFSMKSLTETNSGKLITIISGDMFNVERAITMIPIILAGPCIVLITCALITISAGWQYALLTLILWLSVLVMQHYTNKLSIWIKMKESVLTDQRLKLINDLVQGIRTIKSYAWEKHYMKKIQDIRKK